MNEETATEKRGVFATAKLLFREIQEKKLSGVAKQIAYNILFAMAPLLIFVTAMAGFITQQVNSGEENPVVPVIDWIQENLPADAASVLRGPVENALTTSPGFLLSFGAIIALWGGKNAIAGVMEGLNLCYDTEDDRSWVTQQAVSIGLTVAVGLLLGVTSASLVLGSQLGDTVFEKLGIDNAMSDAISWLQWPVAVVLLVLSVALLHWVGPDVDKPFRWFLPGAVLSVVLWGIAVFALQIYFRLAGNFGEAYGVFGAMLVFIYWLWVMGLMTLVGASFNRVWHETTGDPFTEAPSAGAPDATAQD